MPDQQQASVSFNKKNHPNQELAAQCVGNPPAKKPGQMLVDREQNALH
jgi:hypothetical protein